MTEKDKYSETARLVCYKHEDGGTKLSMLSIRRQMGLISV